MGGVSHVGQLLAANVRRGEFCVTIIGDVSKMNCQSLLEASGQQMLAQRRSLEMFAFPERATGTAQPRLPLVPPRVWLVWRCWTSGVVRVQSPVAIGFEVCVLAVVAVVGHSLDLGRETVCPIAFGAED